jgi:hypothetical protein
MTYNEAIKLYGNSRRKMAEDLGLSVQAVSSLRQEPRPGITSSQSVYD